MESGARSNRIAAILGLVLAATVLVGAAAVFSLDREPLGAAAEAEAMRAIGIVVLAGLLCVCFTALWRRVRARIVGRSSVLAIVFAPTMGLALAAEFTLWRNDALARAVWSPLGATAVWLGVAVGLICAVGFHEGGHAFGAWLTGQRVCDLAIGPLVVLTMPDGRRRLRVSKATELTRGYTAAIKHPPGSAVSHGVLIAGGPLATLVSVAGAGWLLGVEVRGQPNVWFAAVLAAIAVFGASVLAQTIIAFVTGSNDASDGAQLRGLIQSQAAAPRCLGWEGLHEDVRLRDWPQSAMHSGPVSVESMRGPEAIQGFLQTLGGGDTDRARILLDHAVSRTEDFLPYERGRLFAESAYFHALHLHDPVQARAHLRLAGRVGLRCTGAMHRAKAALLFVDGDREAARREIASGEGAIVDDATATAWDHEALRGLRLFIWASDR